MLGAVTVAALAYVFWHTPTSEADATDYAGALGRWHAVLADAGAVIASASWRLPDGAPWLSGWTGPVFEDWYLVPDWAALGRLEHAAVSPRLIAEHDAAATQAEMGVAGLWRGPASLPGDALGWTDEAPDALVVWRRCLTLGPAPQFAVAGVPGPRRERVS
jgi:hypothetical protein